MSETSIDFYLPIQKQSFNIFCDAIATFQDQAERANKLWTDQVNIDEKAHEYADQWRMVLKKGRDDFRAKVNEAYARMEEFWAGLEPNEPSKTQEKSSKRQETPLKSNSVYQQMDA